MEKMQITELITNELLMIVVLIFAISVIVGLTRGFIKIVASLAATLVIMIVVTMATPFVSEAIMKMTPIEKIVQEKCTEILLTEQSETDVDMGELQQKEFTKDEQISLLENAKLPEVFRDLLLENNNGEMYEVLGVTTFLDYVGSYLAGIISNIAAFLLTFVIVSIVVRTIIYMLGIISDLPVISGVNRLAGGALGLGTGLVIVWIVFIVITLMYDTQFGERCFENIARSEFLTMLYDKNILLNLVTKYKG